MADAQRQADTRWVEGMRGTASIGVVISHLVRLVAEHWISPTNTEGKPHSIWQQPPLRLHSQGALWVGIFFTMTGFVNALKPIQKARAGDHEAVFLNLSRSAFKRTGRLVLPTTFATIISWIICQLGGYELARRSESDWIAGMAPTSSATWVDAVYDLCYSILATWRDGGNAYDKIHWTLTWLLHGSFWIYLTLLATARASVRGRTVVVSLLFLYCWATGNVLIGLPVYAGILLAELVYTDPASYRRLHVTPYFLVAIGLYLGCYPERRAETASWSDQLRRLGEQILPAGTELSRALPTVGGILIILGVVLSRPIQKVLSGPFVAWLGKISFALYLIHGTLLKSTLFWMIWLAGYREKALTSIYHTHVEINEDSEVEIIHNPPDMKIALPTSMELLCILPVWWATTFSICHLWTVYIDPRCGQISDWVESKIFPAESKGAEGNGSILPVFKIPASPPGKKEKA